MKHKFYSLLLAALLGLPGMNVGAQNLTTTEIDGVTYYEIGNAAELVAFADLVNGGEFGANAVLTADIALAEPWETPIGNSGGMYSGIFDGQRHKITGFEATSEIDGGGFFGYTSNATIQNFSIDGVLTSTAGTGSGVVGYPANSTIYNVHSTLDISVPVGGVHHVGGVIGSARGGNTISNCTFSGTMTVAAGSIDNFAGIVAYLGGDSVVFCANYGNITFDDVSCAAGGIAGYLNNAGSYVRGCLNMGSVVCSEPDVTPTYGGAIVGRLRTYDATKLTGDCWLKGSASGGGCDGGSDKLAATCFTKDILSTGEICYLLNGDQTTIGWYQTLGTDEQPLLDATHEQVYMVGRLHCNGDVYEGATYTNENTAVIQDDHNIVDGFCSYCGMFDANYLTPNADGFYEIATAGQLVWFEQMVNKGTLDANAILTADIDFADLMSEEDKENPEEAQIAWTPIGDWGQTRGTSSAGYKGHFDGQGHTIKNLNATAKQNYFGLFGVISTDCLIENFNIYGNYKTSYQYAGGVAAYARDDRPTIRGIHSFVNINNTYAGGRQGGILGGVLTTTYKTVIENCTYSGTLDGNDAGGNGNYGGIIGYVNNNGATVADITNCLFDGQVVNNNPTPGNCTFGGFVGYSNGGVVTIKNCLSIGLVESAVYGQFFGAVKSTKSSLPNSYFMGERINGSASTVTLTATETNEDELSSGEIAWKLNGETFLDVVWHQTLGENNYPVLESNEAIVYQTINGYDCISEDDPDSFDSFLSSVIANEQEFIEDEDLVAYQALINEYKEAIESWKDIDNYDDFITAYKASFELKESIKQSAANYAKYVENCEYAINYLAENSVEGVWSDFLKTYLEETVEPNADYPNGSYAYIIENCNLDNEAIAAEIDFVNQMLQNAIAGGVTSGTEITRLLANSTFANGFEGWTTEADGITLSNGGTEAMPILRGLGNGTFNVAQTLTDLSNGIYLMTVNGMFRAGDDVTNPFYAGQLYLNNTANYVMSPGEDVVLAEDAEPGVNCLGEGSDKEYNLDGVIGWVPNGMGGCSVAYGAGRYQNYCATEVTDGTLTVGVRSLGTGLASDWLPFGNMHVYFLGTAEEANEKLADVLNDFAARAEITHDFFPSDDPSDFMKYPNMSEDLKDRLAELIEAVPNAATGEAKMELINRFSALFTEIHACRKAYIAMYDAANKMQDNIDALDGAGLLDDEVYGEWSDKIYDAQGHYTLGDISTEEALAIVNEFNSANLIPVPMSEDGVYQLATAEHVRVFSVLVNSGYTTANAVLTEDIDMSTLDEDSYFESIGSSSNPFEGVFDGQNHKISNFGQYDEENDEYSLILSGDKQGFFGYVKNATVKNFSIDGAVSYNGGTGYGAIGWAEGSTLINIHSSLNIASVSTSHHIGGVCGDMRAGSKAYNCSFSGTITDNHGTHDCIAGIGGYSNENCLYENCANYGTVIYSAANAYAGGICGYVNNDSFTGIFNCINVGTVKMADGTPTYGGAFVGRLRSHSNSKFENNYMLQGSAPNTSGENKINANIVTEEKFQSGEVCYKLNGDQEEINWYQTLGEDTYPVLDDTHKVVYEAGDGTYVNEKVYAPGSKENPFVVKTAADLSNLINLLVSGRMNYVVMEEDVDMAGVTDWTPLFNIADQSNGYPFIDFDGKGHVISNLTSNTEGSYDYCGLFGILCGNVRNLGVKDANVTCTGGTGIIAGYLGHSTYGQTCYVENVWVTGKLSASGYCGGLFGNVANESHITNCYANVEVNGASDLTGGIIGRVRAKIEMNQVYAAGSINRGGGIIGGGQQDATPFGTYNRVAVWNNTENNFGPVREGEVLTSIIYYDGTNFADMQSQVVAWDPEVWSCDMQPGSYPILKAFAGSTGDLNGDGKVDIADAVTVLNIMAAGEYKAEADVNNDQKNDIADFVTILNIMAQQ